MLLLPCNLWPHLLLQLLLQAQAEADARAVRLAELEVKRTKASTQAAAAPARVPEKVRQFSTLVHHFSGVSSSTRSIPTPTRAVCCTLLGARACRMLIGC